MLQLFSYLVYNFGKLSISVYNENTCGSEQMVLADVPLKTPEQDKLGFAPFAKRVASVIKRMDVKESVVFGIYGKWGSGKTTFLNFLTHYLNTDNSVIIVRFNPWWFSGKE